MKRLKSWLADRTQFIALAILGLSARRAAAKETKAWGKLHGFMQEHPEFYAEFLERQRQERESA